MKKPAQTIRTFQSDNRSNPGLHNLHVEWAYDNLRIAKQAINDLADRSQVSAHVMSCALRDAMTKEIEGNAACFEAAALLFAGLEPPRRSALGIDA